MSSKYNIDDMGMVSFYMMPKDLYLNPIYNSLNNNAKVAYMVLRDRQDLSIKNQWLDENGDIFFYFDCNKLATLLNVSTSTINQCKKQLTKFNLLSEERQGQGKPNKMYIHKTKHIDITMISDFSYSSIANSNKLDIKKSLCSNTELINTEKNDTEHLHADKSARLRLNEFDNPKEKLLNDYCIKQFDKPLRLSSQSLDDLYDDIEAEDFIDFLYENISKHNQCNIDYLNSIVLRLL